MIGPTRGSAVSAFNPLSAGPDLTQFKPDANTFRIDFPEGPFAVGSGGLSISEVQRSIEGTLVGGRKAKVAINTNPESAKRGQVSIGFPIDVVVRPSPGVNVVDVTIPTVMRPVTPMEARQLGMAMDRYVGVLVPGENFTKFMEQFRDSVKAAGAK